MILAWPSYLTSAWAWKNRKSRYYGFALLSVVLRVKTDQNEAVLLVRPRRRNNRYLPLLQCPQWIVTRHIYLSVVVCNSSLRQVFSENEQKKKTKFWVRVGSCLACVCTRCICVWYLWTQKTFAKLCPRP